MIRCVIILWTNLSQKINAVKQSVIKLMGNLVEGLGQSVVGMACLCSMIFEAFVKIIIPGTFIWQIMMRNCNFYHCFSVCNMSFTFFPGCLQVFLFIFGFEYDMSRYVFYSVWYFLSMLDLCFVVFYFLKFSVIISSHFFSLFLQIC